MALLFVFGVEPSHAQFFKTTESWLAGAFPNTVSTVIPLIFNVLRALFVIYLGIALVRVLQAARNDDDWQQLARTPLILVVTITIGDILASIITGAGTGG
jgi:hypothetical protein